MAIPRRPKLIALIAKRMLLSKESDGFISLITTVSIIGVALGVLALTVVTSAINGFEAELQKVITGLNGDVILYSRGSPLRQPDLIKDKIYRIAPETKALTASFISELMISGPDGVSGTVLEGIDAETLHQVTVVPERIIKGALPRGPQDIVIGSALAEKIAADVGDTVRMIAPFAGDFEAENKKNESQNLSPKTMEFKVSGIVQLGMYQYDSKFAFASLSTVQNFLEHPDKVTSFKIKLKNIDQAQEVSEKLNKGFGYPFRAKDWSQLNRNLLIAIKLEKVVISIILTAIIVVASFNVVSTLMMMIHDKIKEISILKAMGFRRRKTFQLFVLIGSLIGTTGSILGVLFGLAINWVIQKTHIITLPPDIYHLGFLPIQVMWDEIAMILLITMVICLAVTIYPSLQIARKTPLDGLRIE